jgi:hypothetical protein
VAIKKSAAKRPTAKGQVSPTAREIDVAKLDFDKENPRFPAEVSEGSIEVLLERFVRDERLLEIIESIGSQGYFPGEPLLVVDNGKGRFTVMEGNRRLAALKLLSGEVDAPKGRISVEAAIQAAKVKPTRVACLLFTEKDQILRYLGFRHITGIKSWSALQKARYVQRLRKTHYGALSYESSLKALAIETGSKAPYIGQILAALALYERAERANFFGLTLGADDIDFSILSTALSYTNIVDYLGLASRTDVQQSKLNERSLKNVFRWIFVKGPNGRSIVRDSRNLKKLSAIVVSKDAVKELVKEGRLDEAFELSKGPAMALDESLRAAERKLTSVWSFMPKVTEISGDHLVRAENIAKLSRDIFRQLKTLDLEDAEDD